MVDIVNTDQQQFWSTGSGTRWTEYQVELDSLLSAGTDAVLSVLPDVHGKRILDIGCGTGATSLALARLAGSSGHVHAVDIAQPLLDMAESRSTKAGLANLSWQHADAQTAQFPDPKFDILASRFGVMFFEDPVTAFDNMRSQLTANARVAIACWAPVKQNPWFNIPRVAAVKQLGMPPPTPSRTPGPFAFSNPDYAKDILNEAGFQNVQCHPYAGRLKILWHSGSSD